MKICTLILGFAMILSETAAQTAAPEKYLELRARYRRYAYANGGEEGNEGSEDGIKAQYNRWAWYWRQHLDAQGNLVSPAVTRDEWEKYTSAGKNARVTSGAGNWVFEGPFSSQGEATMGRINVITFDPADSNVYYVGSAAGSTWKTTDNGYTWKSLYDFLPSLGVADIKLNPLNPQTVYVVTGDGDFFDSYSSGIIVSHDGGNTWNSTGIAWAPTGANVAYSMLINPLDTNSMMLATNTGVYKSFNGGASWAVTDRRQYKQIVYDPADTNIVYGSTFNGYNLRASDSAGIMRSANGGLTWNVVAVFSDAQRICLATSPANPAIVKALISDTLAGLNGVYGSTDTGHTFSALFLNDTSCTSNLLSWDVTLPSTGCTGQGYYDLAMAVSPSDPNFVVIGGINHYYSTDGGYTWNPFFYLSHVDQHYLAFQPGTGDLFATCDGGLLKTFDVSDDWMDLSSGIYVTEFYRNAVDNGVSFCLGGAQDNSSMLLDGGLSSFLTGGDGLITRINYGDPADIFYTSYEYGNVFITRDGGSSFSSITSGLPVSDYMWFTPYALHPSDTGTLFLGIQQVYVSHDNGSSWAPISPVFDTLSYLTDLVLAPSNPACIFTAYDDYYSSYSSVIQYTTNSGLSWSSIVMPAYQFISRLTVDPRNENHLLVTIGGYISGTKVMSYDLTTATWTNESGSLPNIPVNCLTYDTSSLTQYVGVETGVFYKKTTMTDWALFNANLPTVSVNDLNINYTSGTLWAATYGRGMWSSKSVDRASGVNTIQSFSDAVQVHPNPNNGVFVIAAPGSANMPVLVTLIAADGQQVWQGRRTFDGGGAIRIATQGLAAGFYMCDVSCENGTARTKMIVY